jgi:hypothetical protein
MVTHDDARIATMEIRTAATARVVDCRYLLASSRRPANTEAM